MGIPLFLKGQNISLRVFQKRFCELEGKNMFSVIAILHLKPRFSYFFRNLLYSEQ